MPRKTIILLLIILVLSLVPNVFASTSLPESAWYAVSWVRDSDTLHWINASGEQASIQRPTWADEDANVAPRMHITPNGRTLIQVVKQTNGRESIAFYNLETAQFLATHETNLGERFIWSEDYPSMLNSPRFAIGLTAPDVSQWRMIAFDTNTGAAVTQLTVNDTDIGLAGNQYAPYVLYYDFDEAINQSYVHFQMRNGTGEVHPFAWYPESNNLGLVGSDYYGNPNHGYDIVPLTGFVVNAVYSGNVNPPSATANALVANVNGIKGQVLQETGSLDNPTWLKSDDWIGYYYQDGVHAAHWRVGLAEQNMVSMPLGPNFVSLHSTPDGFLARDGATTSLMHVTEIPVEAYLASLGNTVFTPGSYYEVIYVTPWGANFALDSLGSATVAGNNLDIAAPETCEGAAVTRLAVGMHARVTFTDGFPLRVRTEPGGTIITELPEGTEFDILAGSQCQDGFLWWQIQTDNAIVGWSAEGSVGAYFIEPMLTVNEGLTIQPTSVPARVIEPTVPPRVIEPTAPARAILANCTASPATRLSIGEMAHTTLSNGGTLAMRTNLGDEYPSYQVPDNKTVTIVAGSQCSANGQRMWQVQTTLNNQSVIGWVAEGWQSDYFLAPGPARAQ